MRHAHNMSALLGSADVPSSPPSVAGVNLAWDSSASQSDEQKKSGPTPAVRSERQSLPRVVESSRNPRAKPFPTVIVDGQETVLCYPYGEEGDCLSTQHPCPGCQRYPALPNESDPQVLTTQTLVFTANSATTQPAGSVISVGAVAAVDPSKVAASLVARGGALPALVAFSAESSTRVTISQRQMADGGWMVIKVDRQGSSSLVQLFNSNHNSPLRSIGRVRVRREECAVFSAVLDGLPRIVVIHPTFTRGSGELMESVIPDLHAAFADAANRYPVGGQLAMRSQGAIALRTERFAFYVQTMDENLLVARLQGAYR